MKLIKIVHQWTIPLIGLLFVIFQLTSNNIFEFHRDELLYFSLSEHTDFGYNSVPPFIGLFAYISVKLFGYTLFAAKFLPAIVGGCLVILISYIVKEFEGGFFARLLASLSFVCTLLFIRASGLFEPVIFDIFFWTLSLYFVLRYIKTDRNKYLIYLGLTIGLGFLNKYNVIFLVIALIISFLITKHRKVFQSKYLYLSAGLSILVILPNIIWQIVYGFPVIGHMSALRDSQLLNVGPDTFLVEQLLMLLPSTIIVFPGLFILLFNKHYKEYRVLGYFSLIVILIYLFLHGKSYYTAGIYPLLIAFSSAAFARIFKNIVSRSILILLMIIPGYLLLPTGKPIYRPYRLIKYFDQVKRLTGTDLARRFEDNSYHQLPQDYADMLGWEELAKNAAKAYQMSNDKQHCILYCENYGEAGAITILGKKYNLPEAICFSESFKYWAPRKFDNEITELIYINDSMGDDVKELFSDIIIVGEITNPLSREHGTRVYLCRKPVKSFNNFWKEVISRIE